MRTTSYRVLNIIGINLLLLALYLNFIHKDNNAPPEIPVKATTEHRTAATRNSDQLIKSTDNIRPRSTTLN